MITLKEALSKNSEEIKEIKKKIKKKSIENNLNSYIDYSEYSSGIPILIKDNIQVKNWYITCASKILTGYKAPYNATVIENLLKNGLSPFGRANMDEFAMGSTTETSYYGVTKNPYGEYRVPGGSSGGSAAAVGGGEAICALGSDTGGSIRQPAAFCGCVGMKPTYGRVSRYGLTAFASSLDQIGPITQTVEDSAILYNILSSNDSKDSTNIKLDNKKIEFKKDCKFKIAVIKNYMDEADIEIQNAHKNIISQLEKDGHTISYENLTNTKYDIATYYILSTAEATSNLSRFDGIRYGLRGQGKDLKEIYINSRSEGFGDEVKRRILLGNFVLSSGFYDSFYKKAQNSRKFIKQEFDNIFKNVDLILTPTTPTVAPEIGSITDSLTMYKNDMFTIGANISGIPAISVPISLNSENMPIGLQLLANSFDENTLFNGASIIEKIANFKKIK